MLLILLALSGIGIVGAFFNRERYANKKVTIELVEKKENENENHEIDQIQIRD